MLTLLLPADLTETIMVALRKAGGLGIPLPLLDYLRFGWVADGARGADHSQTWRS